ncbi:hypothetical protein CPB86DRAFT_709885 [Serendipita vermifera]|nr:hypothetical protein CPB86DRAFT_709885 [Serendipita vermifera]
MATDYWASSHHKKWVTDRLALHNSRLEDLKYASQETLAFLNIFFANLITKLGKKLHFRQRVIATATVFFKRFYLKNSLCETDPYIVLVACCYVAGKAEELPAHIKNVIQVANTLFNDLGVWSTPLDNHRLAEMEFYLVDELECDLTVYHPYRALMNLCGKETDEVVAGSSMNTQQSMPEEVEAGELGGHGVNDIARYAGSGAGKLLLDDRTLQLAWLIINDTYRTDVCLLYPPFLIAVAAIFLSLVNHDRVAQASEPIPKVKEVIQDPMLSPSISMAPTPSFNLPQTPIGMTPGASQGPKDPATTNPDNPDPITFLANLNVSMNTVAMVAQEMLSFYTLSNRYVDDSGSGINTSSSRQKNAAYPEGSLDSFLADTDPKPNGNAGSSLEKVRAKQLAEELKRMRSMKEKDLEAATAMNLDPFKSSNLTTLFQSSTFHCNHLSMRVIVQEYQAVAQWRWKIEGKDNEQTDDEDEDVCGICMFHYDRCCTDCKNPGDDCPLIVGKCTHIFHMHCIEKWINTPGSNRQCPMDRRPWGEYTPVVKVFAMQK